MISSIIPTGSKSLSCTWIVESDTSSYVCNSLDLFANYKSLPNTFVNLLNCQKIYAPVVRTIFLSDSFVLKNVLYIPCFHVNLIYVCVLLS